MSLLHHILEHAPLTLPASRDLQAFLHHFIAAMDSGNELHHTLSSRKAIAEQILRLHERGVWETVWSEVVRHKRFGQGQRACSPTLNDVFWPYLVLLEHLKALGSQRFYSADTLNVLAVALRCLPLPMDSRYFANSASASDIQQAWGTQVWQLVSTCFTWRLRSHVSCLTLAEMEDVVPKLARCLTPLLLNTLRQLPNTSHRLHCVFNVFHCAFMSFRGSQVASLTLLRTFKLLFSMWTLSSITAGATRQRRGALFMMDIPIIPRPCRRLFNLHSQSYLLHPRCLAQLAQVGTTTSLWVMGHNRRNDLDVDALLREVAPTTWDAWKDRYFNDAFFAEYVAYNRRLMRHPVGLRPSGIRPRVTVNSSNSGVNGGSAESRNREPHRRPQEIHRSRTRERINAALRTAHERRQRAMPADSVAFLQNPDFFPPPQSDAVTASSPSRGDNASRRKALRTRSHAFTVEDLERLDPALRSLADMFIDPITQDLIAACPVHVRLTSGALSSKVYDHVSLKAYIDYEVADQHRRFSHRPPVVKDPHREGDIDTARPAHQLYQQPLVTWSMYNTILDALQRSSTSPPTQDSPRCATVDDPSSIQPQKRQRVEAPTTPSNHVREPAQEPTLLAPL